MMKKFNILIIVYILLHLTFHIYVLFFSKLNDDKLILLIIANIYFYFMIKNEASKNKKE